MNYVGSISIIDRGDAPAKAVIDKNTRSFAQRVADETKEELDKVMDRVDNIYVSYEMSTQTMFDNPRGSPNVEYIEDIKELEQILTDTVKKKKYQQQVTVFIVGFQDVSAQKMQLLQQVNQFFLENSKPEEEELVEAKLDIDLEEASKQVHESLSTAEELAKKLNDLNQDIIEWLVNYANTKASNKGKKRLEKNLESAKNDMNSLSEKLLTLQAELEEKDEKFQQVAKQLDTKTQEAIRYKTAAEVAKKLEATGQEKLAKLQEEVESKKMAISDAEREMDKLHRDQLVNVAKAHKEEIEELKQEHLEELSKLTDELQSVQARLSDAEQNAQETFDETDELRAKVIELQLQQKDNADGRPTSSDQLSSGKSIGDLSTGDEDHQSTSKQETRPSAKDVKSTKKTETKSVKVASKSPSRGGKEKTGGRSTKELADASIQDEGGDLSRAYVEKSNDPSRQPTRQSKNLDTVTETGDGQEFSSAYDLDDEESWASVPAGNVVGRFTQYRQLSLAKVKELEDQLNVTLTKTHRKVNSLKQQFSEHKGKWEAERKILIEQVEQAQKLQTDAEKEADAAMTQLEEFINEQEKLEDEEETKRQEIIKTMSRPGTTRRVTPAIVEQKERASPEAAEKTEEEPQVERLHSENSEQELKNLLQQTDDAKAQEKNARQSGAISAPPAVEPDDAHISKSNIDREAIKGSTEDEVRASSAKSRASLRSQFKSRLDETRHAVEERRTKSPVISVPSQKSIDDELILEEDDDDDFPMPDDMKEEALFHDDTMDMGTSPPPGPKEKRISVTSRHSINLSEHPLVQEYLRAYTGIHNFKDAMSRVLVDKDQMSASQILADLDIVPFDKEAMVVPQVSSMTDNIYYVLNEVSQVINSVLQNDRGPVVSSLMMGMSRDPTQRTIVREKTGATTMEYGTRGSQRSPPSTKVDSASSTERQHYKDLQEQYEKLMNKQDQMLNDSQKYENQQRHNMVVMMEMQDTINQLQRELSALGKQSKRPASEHVSISGASQTGESAVMFTRLDSERNAKIMKKAVNEEKLDTSKYKEAMVQMDDYVSLPAQRLAHLVKKYVHHCRMKEIEENVQQSNSLNEGVFDILDKMEALQNQRARRWADRMDEMGMERLRLANMLMETLDDIEQESGIFLIKPMYSYRGREPKERFGGKISRPFRPQRVLSPLRDISSAYAPAPTPASNIRAVVKPSQGRDTGQLAQSQEQVQGHYEPPRVLDGDSRGLLGSSIMASQPRATWSMADSMPVGENFKPAHMNTPRILELDINRMMIGQNTISAQIGTQGASNDRLVNAANNNLRSYVTVNRPTGPGSTGKPGSAGKSDRPNSGSRQSPRPPSSPSNLGASTKRVRMSSDVEIPSIMTSSQPLPPIGGGSQQGRPSSSSGKGILSPTRIPSGDVPPSPPGSSLRQSPTEVV